jgi:hypothetical protein
LRLVAACLPQAAYLIDGLADTPEDDENSALTTLVSLRDLVRQLRNLPEASIFDFTGIAEGLTRLRLNPVTPPGIEGGLFALAVTDGEVDDETMARWLRVSFATGADPDHAVRRLAGLMRVAPDLLLHTPQLFAAVDAVIAGLESDTFLAYLPDLRRSFSALKPVETAALARQVAANTGVATDLAPPVGISETDLARGARLELALWGSLVEDQLGDWARS